MSMLNDRQRQVLSELKRQLEDDDPAWVRQFSTFTPHQQKRTDTALEVSIGIAVVLMALGLAFGNPQVVVTFCGVALILAFVRLTH